MDVADVADVVTTARSAGIGLLRPRCEGVDRLDGRLADGEHRRGGAPGDDRGDGEKTEGAANPVAPGDLPAQVLDFLGRFPDCGV